MWSNSDFQDCSIFDGHKKGFSPKKCVSSRCGCFSIKLPEAHSQPNGMASRGGAKGGALKKSPPRCHLPGCWSPVTHRLPPDMRQPGPDHRWDGRPRGCQQPGVPYPTHLIGGTFRHRRKSAICPRIFEVRSDTRGAAPRVVNPGFGPNPGAQNAQGCCAHTPDT